MGTILKSLLRIFSKNKVNLDIKTEKALEYISGNGKFVSIYKLRFGHVALADDANDMIKTAKLISMLVEIDDTELSINDVFNLPIDFVGELIGKIMENKS
jgi:hypothetical protein